MPTFRLPWDAISWGPIPRPRLMTQPWLQTVMLIGVNLAASTSLSRGTLEGFPWASPHWGAHAVATHVCLLIRSFDPSPEKVHVAPIDTTAVGE
jgi:hypothetical protein